MPASDSVQDFGRNRKQALAVHSLHRAIDSSERLRVFAAHHVVCVWDFMSLLKSLQRDLAGVGIPWTPPSDPEAARLVNEIVLDEESDRLPDGRYGSHFEWYLEAMRELGAELAPFRDFLHRLRAGEPAVMAMRASGVPAAACDFAATTLSLLDESLAVRAAVFLHGREDIIPRMFLPLVERLRATGVRCAWFLGYLERHIEVDGGAHSRHATALLGRLLREGDQADRCAAAVERALAARQQLWDAILRAVEHVPGSVQRPGHNAHAHVASNTGATT